MTKNMDYKTFKNANEDAFERLDSRGKRIRIRRVHVA